MNSEQKLRKNIAKTYKQQKRVLESLAKLYGNCGGDVANLDACGPDEYWDEELKKCMPDVGDEEGPDPDGQ